MDNLEYRIGALHIIPDRLRESNPEQSHRFIVVKNNCSIDIYVYNKDCEKDGDIAKHFGIDKKEIIGRGIIYLDENYSLVINSDGRENSDLGKAKERFAELILPRLRKGTEQEL